MKFLSFLKWKQQLNIKRFKTKVIFLEYFKLLFELWNKLYKWIISKFRQTPVKSYEIDKNFENKKTNINHWKIPFESSYLSSLHRFDVSQTVSSLRSHWTRKLHSFRNLKSICVGIQKLIFVEVFFSRKLNVCVRSVISALPNSLFEYRKIIYNTIKFIELYRYISPMSVNYLDCSKIFGCIFCIEIEFFSYWHLLYMMSLIGNAVTTFFDKFFLILLKKNKTSIHCTKYL